MRIKQLSKHLINQIAAGEVIERPASVVKELVENSIDAKATKISVEITNDCRNLRIADNGSGIHPEDIMLAFSKHATSKIETDEDLFAISTLGFRGEALSSIISIAKVTCITRTKDFDYGTKVECENSEVKKIQTGCAIGTIMQVENLFYNLPARLKFLKNPKTEFSYIQELMQNLAIINPHISFELKNNGKIMLKTSGSNDLKITLKEIFSQDVVNKLKEVLKTDKLSGLKISGLISTPDFTRSSKKDYHIYINSRTIKCPAFQKSIDMSYKNLIGNKYPFVVLNLEIPPQDVDINVHPTKKEVRYKNTNQIFNFIYSAIDMALANKKETFQISQMPKTFTTSAPWEKDKIEGRLETLSQENNDDIYVKDEVLEQKSLNLNVPLSVDFKNTQKTIIIDEHENNQYTQKTQNFFDENIIGQYKNTYILIEKENGLEIVDQHIAEERFIYEKLKKQKTASSQLLFISDIIDISMTEAQFLKENKEKLEKFGYGIEFLKETQIIFKKVPQLLAKVSVKELLTDILENLSGNLDGLEENILKMTACKASVKAGFKLNMYQMQEIIKNWRTCEKPYTCPHGRPICKFIEHKKLASFFDRAE